MKCEPGMEKPVQAKEQPCWQIRTAMQEREAE